MLIDISRFKVVYDDKAMNAVALDSIDMGDIPLEIDAKYVLPAKSIAIFAINEDGNIVYIQDEAWRFQFVPIINRREER